MYSTLGNIMSTSENVYYNGEYHDTCGRYPKQSKGISCIHQSTMVHVGNEGGDSLIKVGTDVWAPGIRYFRGQFLPGSRLWEVNFAQALGFWQFLIKE